MPNIVKFAFGSVASATVALSLSSGAFAADAASVSGAVSTNVVAAHVGISDGTPGPTSNKTTPPTTKNTIADQPSSQAQSATTSPDAATHGSVSGPAEATPVTQSETTVSKTYSSSSGTTTGTGTTNAGMAASDRAHTPVVAETNVSVPADDSLVRKSEILAETPVLPAQTVVAVKHGGAEVVYYHSRPLPVQPVITTSAALPVDLASAMPTASDHNPGEKPAKSNGLLGQLTSVLAGVIVPSSVGFGHALLPASNNPVWAVVVLVVLSLNLFTSSYGLWLRRSGYAHAARSDASAASFTFATPQLMSYVYKIYRHIAHFLVVSDIKRTHKSVFNALTRKGVNNMTVQRFLMSASVVGVAAVSFAGTAMADTVTTQTTGPDSSQETTIANTNDVTTTNNNTVNVINVNVQSASTGNVSANGNTSVQGALASGNATNSATTNTVVTINNAAPVASVPGGGTVGGSGNGGSVGNPGANGGNKGNGSVTTNAGKGSVLGASTVGGSTGMLPSVGASVPMDVSALRALYQPKSDAPTSSLVKQTSGISVLLLVLASILSLVGAAGSAIYAQRKQQLKA